MNNRSRKLIPSLTIDDTITLFEKLNIHGIMLDQGVNDNSGHCTCGFIVNDNGFL